MGSPLGNLKPSLDNPIDHVSTKVVPSITFKKVILSYLGSQVVQVRTWLSLFS